jgi:hypothetical protein
MMKTMQTLAKLLVADANMKMSVMTDYCEVAVGKGMREHGVAAGVGQDG